MVYPAMEGLYPTKFVSWFTNGIAYVQMQKQPEPEFSHRCRRLFNSWPIVQRSGVRPVLGGGIDYLWHGDIFSRRRSPFPTNIFSLKRAFPFWTKYAQFCLGVENHGYHHCQRQKPEQFYFYFEVLWFYIFEGHGQFPFYTKALFWTYGSLRLLMLWSLLFRAYRFCVLKQQRYLFFHLTIYTLFSHFLCYLRKVMQIFSSIWKLPPFISLTSFLYQLLRFGIPLILSCQLLWLYLFCYLLVVFHLATF